MTPARRIAYAGFWRRLLAFLIDSFLFLALSTPLLVLLYGRDYFYWSAEHTGLLAVYGTGDLLLTKLLPPVLIVGFWIRLGATPGKLLLDCRIVDARTLQPIGWKQALLRLFGYLISALPLYLGFFWIGWDKRKQGLHDKLAGTVVLHQADDYETRPLPELMAALR